MSKITDQEYVESGKHLPPFMRDFHDQKDLFKVIHHFYSKGDGFSEISYREAMIYTVDWFLWYMARRGYTLHRSRANVDFRSIEEDIREMKEEQTSAFKSILSDSASRTSRPDVITHEQVESELNEAVKD